MSSHLLFHGPSAVRANRFQIMLFSSLMTLFPEMNAMIMRRFSLPGDVDRARQYVLQSDGVQQTTYLAQRYCHEAVREISKLRPSPERDALIQLSEIVLTRDK
uniref:Decaprenyl diphosphate synthase subunit 1 n=1 Tax=Equus caballus TaxID=9796 RepID=A0A9L0SW04_HORSE